MERWNKLRQILPVVLMVCAGLFFVGGLLPTFLGQGHVGIVYALMGAVMALLTKRITDRHRLQRELMKLNTELELRVKERTAQLRNANKELEAFSYTVAHDLRGPLQQLSGFAELLRGRAGKSPDEDGVRYLDFIGQSVRRMSGLIDDLLNFSKAERVDLVKDSVNLQDLVIEVRQELRHQTEGRNIEWTVGNLPEVHADRSLLRLALVNLLSNALKFTRDKTKAEIEIGSYAEEVFCVIFIRDNGVGFDMRQADKLFGAFQRLHSNHEFEGTGIGLASVQRIVQRHGGRVWAEGTVGAGATFSLSLPRALEAASQKQAKTQIAR
jgi:light-regulated signal transduction histidine kinase (bacteriophytochrome)